MSNVYASPKSELIAEPENTSGMGKESQLPEGIKKWSWGAFFLSWIWAIGNNTWIGLVALIPYVGFIMAFVLGAKGREWAWRNKRWESLEHFNRVQRKWSIWGVAIGVTIPAIGIIAALTIPAYVDYQKRAAVNQHEIHP